MSVSELKHTDECLEYAAHTGKAFCLDQCAQMRRQERHIVNRLAEGVGLVAGLLLMVLALSLAMLLAWRGLEWLARITG